MSRFVYMKHPDIDAGQRFPNDPSVVVAQQARGWVLHTMPKAFDDDALNTGEIVQSAEIYSSEPVLTAAEVEELKGKALDQAIEDAGLPKTGTADEKRAALAEYESGLAGSTTTEGTK